MIISEIKNDIIQTRLPIAKSFFVWRFKYKEDHTTNPAKKIHGTHNFQSIK